MTQSTAAATTETEGSAGVVTVGIDVSDRYSHLCVLGDDGVVLREERVRTTTAALTRALRALRAARPAPHSTTHLPGGGAFGNGSRP